VVRAVASNGGGEVPVVVDECSEVLQLEGDKGVRRGWSIEEGGGSGRHSLMKVDNGVVRAKSGAGRSPPVAGGGQGVEGVGGGGGAVLGRPAKERNGGNKNTAAMWQHPFKWARWGTEEGGGAGRWKAAKRQEGKAGTRRDGDGSERPAAARGRQAGVGGAQSRETGEAGSPTVCPGHSGGQRGSNGLNHS
jgi:hypothetical protein